MFELKNRGEVQQTEDKSTLQGTYENIIYVKEGEEVEGDEVEEGEEGETEHEEVDEGIDFDLKSEKTKSKNNDKNSQKKKSHNIKTK